MKNLFLIIMFIALSGFFACSGNSAQDILDTAKLEEKQNNPEHAKTLYEEVIKKHPNTPFAKEAEERLNAIKKP
ncbi:MAG: tol-pal system YbgF family protein [Desulfatirhabdiaceae bacterium]